MPQNQENWTTIHPNFTSELQKKWEEEGFNYEKCKEWVKMGIEVNEFDFVSWLVNNRGLTQPWALDYIDKFVYKKIYNSYLNKVLKGEEKTSKGTDYGLCKECGKNNTGSKWCNYCNAKRFQENFKNWTSGKSEIDKFIQEHQLTATESDKILEWIPYDKFNNIKHLSTGGFGVIYKAEWIDGPITNWNIEDNKWKRKKKSKLENEVVILKKLNNSKNVDINFLQEVYFHQLINNTFVLNSYGISRDYDDDFLIVMEYMKGGNLREFLNWQFSEGFQDITINSRIRLLSDIANGISDIHKKSLIHQDFHPGNILSDGEGKFSITDLGLCRPISEEKSSKIYGVLPYVAPEVLKGEKYTKAADVYSFAMIAYEMLTGLPPYHDIAHDHLLAKKVCEGLRPKLEEVEIPQSLDKLIRKCWNSNPLYRPLASELAEILFSWWDEIEEETNTEFYQQFLETEEDYEITAEDTFSRSTSSRIHPKSIYTSRLLDFSNLPQPQNNLSQQWQTTALLDLQVKGIEEEIKLFKESLSDEQVNLVNQFIQNNQKLKKDENDEELMEKVGELYEELETKAISESELEKLVYWSEKLVELEQQLAKVELQANIEIPVNK